MNAVAELILSEVPDIFAWIKQAHATANPEAPPLTSQEIIDGFESLFRDSFARDEALKIALQAEIDAER